MIKHVVFDRDGTLINFVNFLTKPYQVTLNLTFLPLLTSLLKLDIPISLHTNQSGVQRGYFSLDDVVSVNSQLVNLLSSALASPFSFENIYIAPSKSHQYRKPTNSVLLSISSSYSLQLDEILMIGDTIADYDCSVSHSTPFIFFRGLGSKPDVNIPFQLHENAYICHTSHELLHAFSLLNN